MTSRRWQTARCVAFFVFALLAFMQPVRAVEVIVNSKVATIRLTNMEIRAIFTMRLRNWPDGSRITVFVLDDNAPAQVEFAKTIMDMFPYQLRRYWDRLVFSGTGQAPTEVHSLAEMHDLVASTPGAIGYLGADQIDEKVRVVKVGNP